MVLPTLATLLFAAPLGAQTHAEPAARVNEQTLRAQLDVGGLLISSWFVPQSRTHIEAALDNARISLRGEAVLNGEGLLLVAPVVGPWILAGRGSTGGFDRALLITTGLMQLAGLTVATLWLTGEYGGGPAKGPVLSFSPIVAGHLGLSVKLKNF